MPKLASEVSGFSETEARIDKSIKAVQDLSPLWRAFLGEWRASEKKYFNSSTKFRYSPGYARWKARTAPSAKSKVLTGALRDSLQGGAQSVANIRPHSAEFGTKNPTARLHPGWRVVWLGPKREKAWKNRIRNYVLKEVGR